MLDVFILFLPFTFCGRWLVVGWVSRSSNIIFSWSDQDIFINCAVVSVGRSLGFKCQFWFRNTWQKWLIGPWFKWCSKYCKSKWNDIVTLHPPGLISKLWLPGSPRRRDPTLGAPEPRHSNGGRRRSHGRCPGCRKAFLVCDASSPGVQSKNRTDRDHTSAHSAAAAGRPPSNNHKQVERGETVRDSSLPLTSTWVFVVITWKPVYKALYYILLTKCDRCDLKYTLLFYV